MRPRDPATSALAASVALVGPSVQAVLLTYCRTAHAQLSGIYVASRLTYVPDKA